jgi:hypothetical protein
MELQSAYAWAIDGRATEEFARVFTPDVDANYVEFVRLTGVDSLGRWMEAFHAPFDSSQHLISNHWIAVDGADVIYRSYVQVRLMQRGHPGGDLLSTGAYYLDHVARTESGWRISAREVRNMWRGGNRELIELGRRAVADLGLLPSERSLDTQEGRQ